MKYLVSSFALFLSTCLVQGKITDIDIEDRVVGGQNAPDGAVPWQVSLTTNSGNEYHFCGAAVITQRWLLTAAHCVNTIDRSSFDAVVGTNSLITGGTVYKIKKIVSHKDYGNPQFRNDIAILMTEKTIEYTEKVKPIELASRDTQGGAICLLTGWGYTDQRGTILPENLQWLNVTALSVSNCTNEFAAYGRSDLVSEKQICTLNKRGEGTCQGDSGGALVEQNEAVGIVSFNSPCARGIPDVYTRVFKYLDWIKQNMDANPIS